MVAGYRISSEYSDMDLKAIHQFISRSYWASGIPIETLEKAMSNSLCFGVFESKGLQVGFARVVTDCATFAYLCDVYVLEEHRGKGLSKWLLEKVRSHPDLLGLRRMLLATFDAHGLYKKYGFSQLAQPEIFMENWNQDVYKNT